jgi:hypothetical protein
LNQQGRLPSAAISGLGVNKIFRNSPRQKHRYDHKLSPPIFVRENGQLEFFSLSLTLTMYVSVAGSATGYEVLYRLSE